MLTMKLGSYQDKLDQVIGALAEAELVERIWRHDYTVWRPEPDEIVNRLGWLTLPARIEGELADLDRFADELYQQGFRQAILLGMGGSSLAPEVFRKTFGVADGRLDLQVLDSTDPAVIDGLRRSLDIAQTIFIVATKSGTTVETLSFFKYFYNETEAELGSAQAGQHFVAITDPGSPLIDTAERLGFRRIFKNDPNLGGRYSALSYFGLVPAALIGMNLGRLIERATEVVQACQAEIPYQENPAVRLGAAIGELAKAGRNKLTLLPVPEIEHFSDWLEQLLAESTGKDGVGIVPVVGEALASPAAYGTDRVFVELGKADDASRRQTLAELAQAGHPVLRVDLADRYDLGGQIFLWELATAIAGQRLGIHPFNQPNVESAKKRAKQMVAAYQEQGRLPQEKPAWQGEHMSLYWGSPHSDQQASFDNMPGAFSQLLASARTDAYLGLQAYLPYGKGLQALLRRLQASLRDKTGFAVTLGYGPRFLHSTGQLHKGDSGHGLFIQLTRPPAEKVAIPEQAGKPETALDFGTLIQAQALGDRQALVEAGREVLRVDIQTDLESGLAQLLALVDQISVDR